MGEVDFKDVYCEGLTVGMALGRKLGIDEAIRVLVLAHEQTAAKALTEHYNKLLADERAAAETTT